MKRNINLIKFVATLSLMIGFNSSVLAQGYGSEGRVLAEGEVPAPNAVCQTYGYKNIMQTRCFDSEPTEKHSVNNPSAARNIDLYDTVKEATSGDHRTVYTYRDKSGILHYTEDVPPEYKNIATVFKRGTISTPKPEQLIAYPQELAGPAVPAVNPSIGSNYNIAPIPADKGVSSSGVRMSAKNGKGLKLPANKNVSSKANTKNAKKPTNAKTNKSNVTKKSQATPAKKNAAKPTAAKTAKTKSPSKSSTPAKKKN